MNVLGINGSLRKDSTNMGLLRYAQDNAPEGMEIDIADLTEVPFYNSDIAEKPAAVETLLQQLEQADALLLACPEYNYSLAPALKNALDWASREPDNHLLAGKPVAILGAGGGVGTARAQYHLRQVCVYLDLHPLNKPEVFVNAFAGTFDNAGALTSEDIMRQVEALLSALKSWTEKVTE
ncbi:NAD(P)H-dependent FMN reductase [Malonomonas rubra DSM 5091]|uniref:NAD(P)H-dependent FMN reductase n=1 Tax=Malonomonas rubra DSM 5091 TaxID=1122189 RepID=A0A1M6IST8_MALRU|nr:NAD(P)H-dependent oxidoreductase [Malonomonas rubra]SHJ37533.1 NAD(P)H-dependent FMN reductase [Malonomonas rubra DSM 5091]